MLTYHLERENGSGKNELFLRIEAPRPVSSKEILLSLASGPSEKALLESLLKRVAGPFLRLPLSSDFSFEICKKIGALGKLFYQDKKILVDPFTAYALYFEAEQLEESTRLTGFWKLGNQSGALHQADLVFSSWILQHGILRAIKDDIAPHWVRLTQHSPKIFARPELEDLLLDAKDEEIPVHWKGDTPQAIEPLPILQLTDRHGAFADLYFDYGPYGIIASHHPSSDSWRQKNSEKSWEKDLLETDFIAKIVDQSHYYCPLDKVAKSLTFLLEIGWTVIDAKKRKVFRQKKADFDAQISPERILIRGTLHYDQHRLDLKDVAGAFNRRESFIELSPDSVALLDRETFSTDWDFGEEQEIVAEGISLKKNRVGFLESFLDKLPAREDLKTQIEKMLQGQPTISVEPSSSFHGTLFSYQKEGLQWLQFLQEGGFGGLLADEMGLGKTVQVLAFLSQHLIARPCLIVVPTSLLFNWQREIEKFLPGYKVYRHEGKDRLRHLEELQQKSLILTSYALLRLDAPLLHSIAYQVVILDEAQAIKNPDSQIAKICFGLSSQMRLAITGTPIENRSEDLWSIFHFLLPDLLQERAAFQSHMHAAQADGRYLERIKRKIRPFILRRKKEQVALQLPPKLEQTVFVEMNEEQRTLYERWLQNTKQGLLKKISLDGASSHRMEILEAILRLRQLCAHPWLVEERQEEDPTQISSKLDRLMADVQEVIEEKRKVLVYSQFTQMLHLMERAIKEKGWKYVYLDGSSKDREESVRQFQEDPETQIFLISLKAGGVGLNLTAADYVFLYDPWWNEAAENQAIDRAHRLGKTGTVIARRYITALSIEEKIMHLKSRKTQLSHALLDNQTVEEVSLEDLLDLLH